MEVVEKYPRAAGFSRPKKDLEMFFRLHSIIDTMDIMHFITSIAAVYYTTRKAMKLTMLEETFNPSIPFDVLYVNV